MRGFIEGSVVVKLFKNISGWFSKNWQKSEIGWLFTRNLNDIKIRNSVAYKVINTPMQWLNNIKLPNKLQEIVNSSAILNIASKFEYGVLATVFLAPFIPTIACLGLAILTLFSYLIHKLIDKTDQCKIDAFGFLTISLIIIFGFFAVTSLAAKKSMQIWLLYAPFILFAFLVIKSCNTKEKLKRLVAVFLTASLFVSLYGIYQQFFGTNDGHSWLDDEMFTSISVRVYSTFENPNVLGEYLLLVIPLCGAMTYTCKKLISKLYYTGILGSAALCMIFTQSRGCWVGLILIAAIFAILVDKRLIILGVIAMFFLPLILPTSIITRFTSIGNLNDSSTSYRLYIWLGTLNMLKDFGIYGIGLGSDAYNKIYPFYSYSSVIAPHAHNIYLQLLCETGIIGLGTFLVTMIVAIKKMFLGFISDKKGFTGILAATVIAGLFGFLMQGAFDYVWYNYRVFFIFWIFIGIGIAARRVQNDKNNTCNQ